MTFAILLLSAMAVQQMSTDKLAAKTDLSRYTILKAKREGNSVHLDTARPVSEALDLSLDFLTRR